MAKLVQIIHNPTAGNGNHSKDDLVKIVSTAGYDYKYVSTDEDDWKDFTNNTFDFILLAGGDGTVRKLSKQLLNKMPYRQIPIYLLPLGTANNIALTLNKNTASPEYDVNFNNELMNYDCGRIEGLNENTFVESIGLGIFPELIQEMENQEFQKENISEKLNRTLKVLLDLVKKYKAQKAKIKTDGITIKGSFLMIELMNIKSVGPNIMIAPGADTEDGYFDLAMITEDDRGFLENYIQKMINGNGKQCDLNKIVKILRVQNVKIKWKGDHIHIDDKLVNNSGKKFSITMMPAAMTFIK